MAVTYPIHYAFYRPVIVIRLLLPLSLGGHYIRLYAHWIPVPARQLPSDPLRRKTLTGKCEAVKPDWYGMLMV